MVVIYSIFIVLTTRGIGQSPEKTLIIQNFEKHI